MTLFGYEVSDVLYGLMALFFTWAMLIVTVEFILYHIKEHRQRKEELEAKKELKGNKEEVTHDVVTQLSSSPLQGSIHLQGFSPLQGSKPHNEPLHTPEPLHTSNTVGVKP